jgi:hypothetical protein
LFRITCAPVDGNIIGVDLCLANVDKKSVYAVTDTGKIYTIVLTGGALGDTTIPCAMNPGFPSVNQSLINFKPAVDALCFRRSNRPLPTVILTWAEVCH